MDTRKLLRVAEAAEAVGISRSLLYRLVMSGQVRSVVVGGRSRRIPVEAIDEFIARELADQAEANNVQSDLPWSTSSKEEPS